jgi:hypothetical protein
MLEMMRKEREDVASHLAQIKQADLPGVSRKKGKGGVERLEGSVKQWKGQEIRRERRNEESKRLTTL